MSWFRKHKTLDEVSVRPPADVLRKIAKILVIDDDPNSFPLKPLQAEGYHIEQWTTVQDMGSLERGEFDIVFLDVLGVAEDWSLEDGMGILEHVKAVNPTQVIVAFSAHTFDLSKAAFWRLADDTLRKPVEALRCKQIIDNLLVGTFTFQHFWKGMKDVLQANGVPQERVEKLESDIAHAIETGSDFDYKAAARALLAAGESAGKLVGLAGKIATLAEHVVRVRQ